MRSAGGTPLSGGPTPMTEYIYDAEGQRVAKGTISTWSCDPTSNGFTLTESYVLDQSAHEVTQLDGSGNWQRTNVYAAGSLLATYDTIGLHFHLTDTLGHAPHADQLPGQPEEECQSWPYGDQLYCYEDAAMKTPTPRTPPTTPLRSTLRGACFRSSTEWLRDVISLGSPGECSGKGMSASVQSSAMNWDVSG
jgi:hypothetical protein